MRSIFDTYKSEFVRPYKISHFVNEYRGLSYEVYYKPNAFGRLRKIKRGIVSNLRYEYNSFRYTLPPEYHDSISMYIKRR